jgi:HD-like signal output (HDOD) protein
MPFTAEGVPTANMRDLERQICGADHCAFGAGLCEGWKFPQSFAYVTGYHHDPRALPEANRLLTAVVYVADRLSADLKYGFRGDLTSTAIEPSIAEQLHLTPEHVERIRSRMPQVYDEVEATFR